MMCKMINIVPVEEIRFQLFWLISLTIFIAGVIAAFNNRTEFAWYLSSYKTIDGVARHFHSYGGRMTPAGAGKNRAWRCVLSVIYLGATLMEIYCMK